MEKKKSHQIDGVLKDKNKTVFHSLSNEIFKNSVIIGLLLSGLLAPTPNWTKITPLSAMFGWYKRFGVHMLINTWKEVANLSTTYFFKLFQGIISALYIEII